MRIEGLERLRFTSPHPIGFRDDLIERNLAIAETCRARSSSVAIRLEQNSQSDAPRIHRGKYLDLVERIRRARNGVAITTDIIVGFPGETDDDYRQTRDLVEEIQFDNAFVFRYSPRRDTPAAEMPDQIDEHVKEERNQDLLEVVNKSISPDSRPPGWKPGGSALRRPQQNKPRPPDGANPHKQDRCISAFAKATANRRKRETCRGACECAN